MPKQPRDLAQLLIRKAEADLRSASLLLGDDDLVDPACFHIQQASEKLLKALLASAGSPIRSLMIWANCCHWR